MKAFTIGARTQNRSFRLFNGTHGTSRVRWIGGAEYLFIRLRRLDGSGVVIAQPVDGDALASRHYWTIAADGRLI